MFCDKRFILDVDYRLRVTWIVHQQIWGTKLKTNHTCGYTNQRAGYIWHGRTTVAGRDNLGLREPVCGVQLARTDDCGW
jgi:hypothetical protein